MKNQEAVFSQNAAMKLTTPSLKFFKPTLATTLAIVLAWLVSVRPAQAGYSVTLQQVGPDVVATGSGAINLTGLTFFQSGSLDPHVSPYSVLLPLHGSIGISTGPTSSSVDNYSVPFGPTSFGTGGPTAASSGSGDMVGIARIFWGSFLSVPTGYVSGTALSDMAIYSGMTFATLGVTPGTYVWTWGTGANQKFTLKILSAILPATHITNISTRSFVQTGDNVMIGGFIVQGTSTKRVIIRAIGPELSQYGVPNPLADPTLELHDGNGALIASNNNWLTTIIGGIITHDQVQDIQNSGHALGDAMESAIIADLPPGNYTAIVRGVNNTTGVALVEVYDIGGGSSSILGNISTRSFVQTGDNVMIDGFIVQGTGTKRVIIRAIGPELSQYGVPNPLANPTLELHDGPGTLIASNDNWQTTIIGGIITQDQVQDIQNSGHAPGDPMESAIIANLPAGNYTAIVRGVNSTTGVALVEVYDLD